MDGAKLNREKKIKRLCGNEAEVIDFILRKDVAAIPGILEAGTHITGCLYMNRKEPPSCNTLQIPEEVDSMSFKMEIIV